MTDPHTTQRATKTRSKRHFKTYAALATSTVMGVTFLTATSNSHARTVSVPMSFQCHLTDSKGLAGGIYESSMLGMNVVGEITAPETVTAGESFDYKLSFGRVDMSDSLSVSGISAGISGASQLRLLMEKPANASNLQVTQTGGDAGVSVSETGKYYRLGGASDTDKWDLSNSGPWGHGGWTATKGNGRIGFTMPDLNVNMTADAPGTIAPTFAQGSAQANSPETMLSLYATVQAPIVGEVKAVVRCAPSPGTRLPSVRVLAAPTASASAIQVAPVEAVDLGQKARVTATVDSSLGGRLANANVVFSLDGQNVTATTNQDGVATAEITTTQTGERTVTVSSGSVSATTTVMVNELEQQAVDSVVMSPVSDVELGGNAELTATVTKDGQPVAGQPVAFNLDGQQASGVTNDAGVATVTLPATIVGTRTARALAGSVASTTTVNVTSNGAPATGTYVGPTAITSLIASPDSGMPGDEAIIATTLDQPGTGKIQYFLGETLLSEQQITDSAEVDGRISIPEGAGPHTITARFVDAQGNVRTPDNTITVTTESNVFNKAGSGKEEGDISQTKVLKVNNAEPVRDTDGVALVRPGDTVTYYVRTQETSSSFIRHMGLNPPKGFTYVEGSGDLEGEGEQLVDRGGVYVGPTSSTWPESNAEWSKFNITVDPEYRGFTTTGSYRATWRALTISYKVPETATAGDYQAQFGQKKYNGKILGLFGSDVYVGLSNGPSDSSLKVRVQRDETAPEAPAPVSTDAISITGPDTVAKGDSVELVARPVNASGEAMPAGTAVRINFGTQVANGVVGEDGTFTHTFTATEAGAIRAYATSDEAQNSTTVNVTEDAVTLQDILVDGPSQGTVGETITYTAVATGSDNRPLANTEITLDFGEATHTATTNDEGVATFSFAPEAEGTVQVSARSGETTSLNTVTTVIAPAPAKATELEAEAPATATDGDNVTFTAKVLDQYGQPFAGESVTITWTGPAGTTGEQSVQTRADGTASVTVEGAQVGTYNFTAAAFGQQATASTTVERAASVATTLVAEGTAEAEINTDGTYTATVTDQYGAPMAGVPVTFQLGSGGGEVETNAEGKATWSAKLPGVPGEAEITVSARGVDTTQKVTTTVLPIAVNDFKVEGPASVEVGQEVTLRASAKTRAGEPFAGLQVTIKDANGRNHRVALDDNGEASVTFTATTAGEQAITIVTRGISPSVTGEGFTMSVTQPEEPTPPTTEQPEPTEPPTTEQPEPTEPPTTEQPEPTEPPTTEQPEPTEPPTTEQPEPTEPPTTEQPEPTEPPTTEQPEPTEPPTTEQPAPPAPADIAVAVDQSTTVKAGETFKVPVTLKDQYGKPLANADVAVTYNGETITVKTNSRGQATATFTAAAGATEVTVTAGNVTGTGTITVEEVQTPVPPKDTEGSSIADPSIWWIIAGILGTAGILLAMFFNDNWVRNNLMR